MKKFNKNILPYIGVAGIIGSLFLGVRGCNVAFNNRTIDNPSFISHSYAVGLYGHVEYTKYSDGSRDVKIYPGFAHRLFDSELHQDLDGDEEVDRIRRNGAEWKMNRLSELLVRENDYEDNKERFDEADEQLRQLIDKYDAEK